MTDLNYDIVRMKHGSHLYGLNTENSDVDYKGVYIPKFKEMALGTAAKQFRSSTGDPHEKNQAGDIDEVIFSLNAFIDLACKGEMIAIDMLHAPNEMIIYQSPIWRELQSYRHMFYTKNMKAFVGYAKKQAAKYGIKGSRLAALEELHLILEKHDYYVTPKTVEDFAYYVTPKTVEDFAYTYPDNEFCQFIEWESPTGPQKFYEVLGSKFQLNSPYSVFRDAIRQKYESYGHRAQAAKTNEGIDWKAVSHALRAGYQLKEIYETGDLQYPLKDREFLLKVKLGELDFLTEVQPVLESLVDEVQELAKSSTYPEKVDRKFFDKFLESVYKNSYLVDNTRALQTELYKNQKKVSLYSGAIDRIDHHFEHLNCSLQDRRFIQNELGRLQLRLQESTG